MLVTRRNLLQWVTADRAVVPATLRRGLRADVGGAGARGRGRSSGGDDGAAPAAAGGADPGAVVPVAAARLHHRFAARASPSAAQPRTARRTAPHGTKDLAVLRRAADAGRQLAHPRQLSGEPRRRHRASHVAHQHRAAAPGRARRLRLRLSQHHRRHRSPGTDLRHAAADAALSRAFLQLVRHADARAAASGLHLDGRQRQSRRLFPHPSIRPDRADRITAARSTPRCSKASKTCSTCSSPRSRAAAADRAPTSTASSTSCARSSSNGRRRSPTGARPSPTSASG